jgi:hypothetical protein
MASFVVLSQNVPERSDVNDVCSPGWVCLCSIAVDGQFRVMTGH